MQKNNQPLRTCFICRAKHPKESFIRIVKTPDNQVVIDNTYKTNGRGVYICKNHECVQKTIKSKAINRALKQEVDVSVYTELAEHEFE